MLMSKKIQGAWLVDCERLMQAPSSYIPAYLPFSAFCIVACFLSWLSISSLPIRVASDFESCRYNAAFTWNLLTPGTLAMWSASRTQMWTEGLHMSALRVRCTRATCHSQHGINFRCRYLISVRLETCAFCLQNIQLYCHLYSGDHNPQGM